MIKKFYRFPRILTGLILFLELVNASPSIAQGTGLSCTGNTCISTDCAQYKNPTDCNGKSSGNDFNNCCAAYDGICQGGHCYWSTDNGGECLASCHD